MELQDAGDFHIPVAALPQLFCLTNYSVKWKVQISLEMSKQTSLYSLSDLS